MRRTIKVDYLARVEGEGGLWIEIDKDQVKNVQLKIFEPPRFFEAFLRGRPQAEVPDITARICGICPVAYQMSAVHALEKISGVVLPAPLRDLRRLLYCGEWIESHGLHIYMLHAPDFLGYPDAIQMAKEHKHLVEMGLQLKKVGNEIVRTVGGREIHPINVKVGGFFRLPTKSELAALRESLLKVLPLAEKSFRWSMSLPFPDFNMNYEFVALVHPEEYPFNEGEIISSQGLKISPSEFENHFEEIHVAHSNALHCHHKGFGSYMVGPMARYNLNFEKLPPELRAAATEVGLPLPCRNPFQSIAVRALEVWYALHEAIRVVDDWIEPDACAVDVPKVAGRGTSATEAPRGLLYHRYEVNTAGEIVEAKIIPPTSQNQMQIEKDLFHFVQPRVRLAQEELQHQCEQAVRNYDPCISCATHFLKLDLKRT